MKKTCTLLAFMAFLMAIGIVKANAQVVDVCAGNDTVELHLGNYQYGYVQWQVSEDNETWFNIDGAINTVYRFLPERPQFYRAEVRFPACMENNYYSQVSYVQMPPKAFAGPDLTIPAGTVTRMKATQVEGAEGEWNIIEGAGGLLEAPTDCHTGFIGEEGEYKLTWTVTNSCGSNTDTVSIKCVRMEYQTDLVIVDETDAILSDSTQRLNGEYIISFNDPVPDIQVGSVMLGYMYPSFLRKVVSFEREGNLFVMQTEAGVLTDVIMSGALNFDPIVDATNKWKPTVKYLDRFPTRKEMQENPFLLRDGSIYYIKDADKGNTPIDFEFEVGLSSEGYLSFNLLEFDFKKLDNKLDGLKFSSEVRLYPNFDANIVFDNLDFKEARIGFYNARLEFIQNVRLTKPLTTTLVDKDGYFNKNQIMAGGFMIGPIPTFVMIDLPYIFKVEASIEPPMSFTKTDGNTYTFEMYYNYETGQFQTIKEKGTPFHDFTSEKPIGSIGAEFETGIKASILLADVFGPYFGVSGHFDPSICASAETGDIGGNIHMSLDLSLGCRFQLFSHNLTLFDRAVDFRVVDYNEPAPKKLIKYGGDNQVYTFGQYLNLPVSVKVNGWFNTPMPLAYVHFTPENGVVSDSVVATDIHGIATTRWKPGVQYGIDKLRVKVYDCYGNLAGETPQTFRAYSSATDPCINSNLTVEAYDVNENTIIPLVNGGTRPYLYSTDGESYSTTQPTIHVEPGHNYHLCVRDARGCEAETWYNAPPVSCDNSSLQLGVSVNGNTITAVAMGSIWQPFQYSIGGSFQSSPVFSNLFDGEYTVRVRDRVGCERSKHVVISRPGDLNISITEITNGSGNAMVLTPTSTLIDRGICWSTHHTPTVQDLHNSYGPGSGYYTFTITALDPTKTYYVRAYALDASGTSYSREVCINPSPNTALPVVAATGITSVTQTTAVGSGNVTYEGDAPITERGICWGMIVNPTIASSHISCGSGMGAFTANLTGLIPNRTYYARAYATNSYGTAYGEQVEFFTGNGGGGGGDEHEYVDLGLPSGTLWATCNVGAETPEDYGDYFAWGETQPKDDYGYNTYQHCNGSGYTLTKYCNDSNYGFNGFTDDLTTLLPEDDAASANWGSGWRMPTKEEWRELLDNTTNIFTTQNGVNGKLFTAANGNSLFLPFAGYRMDDELYFSGFYGQYWSSSLYASFPCLAGYFNVNMLNPHVSDYGRDYGHSVRAVCSASPLGQLPQVTMPDGVIVYLDNTAECYVEVVSDGGFAVTERGVCWGIDHNPTIYGSHASVGSGTGSFSYTISGLEANTTYYVRAYATNSVGTAYSDEVSFTTHSGGSGEVPEGAINGLFSVAPGYQVYFSQGNLQYIGSAGNGDANNTGAYWKFAEHQWDCLGETTGQNSDSQTVDRDLFGWGTSGWDNGNIYYQPWSTSFIDDAAIGFGYGPTDGTNYEYDLTGAYANADWGHNPISNGGNTADQWRTLTGGEWDYVTYRRLTTSGILFAKANVNDVDGIILLPDDWSAEYYSLNSTNTYEDFYSSNTITATDWSILEQHGAVFLPVAGIRDGTSYYTNSIGGTYWSASCHSIMHFETGIVLFQPYNGLSVRLVCQDVSYGINATPNPVEGGMVSGAGTYAVGSECTLTATASAGYTFVNWTENGTVVSTNAIYTFTVNGNRDLGANFALSSGNDHEYVDLGLPSGTLWATCNVGANAPENYGDYFAWGETQPKDYYDWSTYQYCNGSENTLTLTKYCNNSDYGYNGFTDNLTALLPEDDAATANWGNGWRMPTQAEWQELLDNTTVTWMTQNGVNGRRFTAPNGNSIFLPAAGCRIYSSLHLVGSAGNYWSSSLYTGDPRNAWFLDFDSRGCGMYNIFRRFGNSVRAVRSASQNTVPKGAIDGNKLRIK